MTPAAASNPFGGGRVGAAPGTAASNPSGVPSTPPRTGSIGSVTGAGSAGSRKGVATPKNTDPYSIALPSGGGDRIRMDDPLLMDQLMLIEPVTYTPSIQTSASNEPTDVWTVNIIVLTGEAAGQQFDDVAIFQRLLKQEITRVDRGENRFLFAWLRRGNATPGRRAPYLFVPPTEEDFHFYEEWRASKPA